MNFSIDFDRDESYISGRTYSMPGGRTAELRRYRIDPGTSTAILEFEGSIYRKIPLSRLLRVTDA